MKKIKHGITATVMTITLANLAMYFAALAFAGGAHGS